jgi:hypothetical protein
MARLMALVLAFLLSAEPALAHAGRLGGGGELNISLTRIVTALLLCLMLAALAVLLLKRSGGKFDLAAIRRLIVRAPADRRITVIETRRVSQHADVCLLRCDGRDYLILCAAQQQTVLRDTPAAEPAA